MARWIPDGPDRWVRDDDERHLLLHAGTRYVEWHGTVVHCYDGPQVADADNPLGEATYVRTEPRGLHKSGVAELWDVLASPRYTQPDDQAETAAEPSRETQRLPLV